MDFTVIFVCPNSQTIGVTIAWRIFLSLDVQIATAYFAYGYSDIITPVT